MPISPIIIAAFAPQKSIRFGTMMIQDTEDITKMAITLNVPIPSSTFILLSRPKIPRKCIIFLRYNFHVKKY